MSGDLRFVLVDASQGASTSDGGKLSPALLGQLAAILTIYANRDVSAEYGGSHLVRAASDGADIGFGEIPVMILRDLSNAPGAIAYHDRTAQGAPDIFDGITLSDTLLGAGNSLLVALSHEVAETIADEGANLIATGDDGRGYAREACDPVEQQSYPIELADGTIGYVSNFVLRSYFVPGHPGPYDFMTSRGLIGAAEPPGPLQVAPGDGGNYQIVYSSVGGAGQVTGSVSLRRALKKRHPTSRTFRRGVRL